MNNQEKPWRMVRVETEKNRGQDLAGRRDAALWEPRGGGGRPQRPRGGGLPRARGRHGSWMGPVGIQVEKDTKNTFVGPLVLAFVLCFVLRVWSGFDENGGGVQNREIGIGSKWSKWSKSPAGHSSRFPGALQERNPTAKK